MCGIGGIIGGEARDLHKGIDSLLKGLHHRGPDDSGSYRDSFGESKHVSLVHTRLSILDLTTASHQPMSDESGRYTIVFNGEIYNFRQLRQQLQEEGCQFKSQGDTEVLLNLYIRRGESMLNDLLGMFAFAIWDRIEQTCFLARDPFGIKPLYYQLADGKLIFASEFRAIQAVTNESRFSEESVAQYFLYGSVPEPHTVLRHVHLLDAGHHAEFRNGELTKVQYWKPSFTRGKVAITNAGEATRITRDALDASIQRHFVSDVPVGIFLSGGIDSTALVALAKANGFSNLKTFSISFDEREFDEGTVARRTAEHFGTEHHDWRLTAEEGKKLVTEFLAATDRPSNDGFNTFCVSRFAATHGMKVVLSGLGGDEFFAGYPSFLRIPQLLKLRRALEFLGPLRAPLGYLCSKLCFGNPKLERVAIMATSRQIELPAYWAMRGIFTPKDAMVLCQHIADTAPCFDEADLLDISVEPHPSDLDLVSYLEITRYMRHQLLRDSDIYSMAHGLELRVPFIDRALFEAVAKIDANVRLAQGKKLLVSAIPELPSWILGEPKKGFCFPFEKWANAQWQNTFSQAERESPVALRTWPQKWTYFMLKHCLSELKYPLIL